MPEYERKTTATALFRRADQLLAACEGNDVARNVIEHKRAQAIVTSNLAVAAALMESREATDEQTRIMTAVLGQLGYHAALENQAPSADALLAEVAPEATTDKPKRKLADGDEKIG